MRHDSPYATASEPLADYLQHYGLASDPFSDDPEFPFFGGGQRRQLLEQLLHLCQFSASLLAVLGESGVGKTRMAHALVQALSAEQDLAMLDAQPGCQLEQILRDIARCFDLAGSEAQTQGQLLSGLRRFGQSVDELDSLALIVIDNAHNLDEQTLGGLLSLLQGQDTSGRRLHLVLFAAPELAQRLDQFGMHDVLIHDFHIDAFNLAEATDYLNFRLEMSDYLGPELFAESLVEPWWRRAEGDIGQLHDQAHHWLLESVLPANTSTARGGLPLVHIIAVSLLLGILMMALLYRSGDAPPEPEPLVLEPRPRIPPEPPVPEAAALKEPVGTEIEPLVPEVVAPEVEPEVPDVAQPPAPPSPPQPSEPRLAELTPQPAAPPQPAVPSSPSPRELPARPPLPEDEQILLSWRESEFTLQLLGASSEQAVSDYVSRQANRDQLLVYRSERQGKAWYVVVTGRYADADAARAAIPGLPEAQRQAGPWARQLSGVQKEIEAARGLN